MNTHDGRGQHIVITGSTRGIGRGLAQAFLALGSSVTVSGRSQEAVLRTVAELETHGAGRVHGVRCDVSAPDDLEALWEVAKTRFGSVDVWINNAGVSHSYAPFWELAPQEVESVVRTNLLGVLYGTRVAFTGMLAQGHGRIFNMEGLGSDGMVQPRTIVYGTSKAAVAYFTRAAIREARGTRVMIGTLSPGMVVTDLLMGPMGRSPQELERARKIFNILADRVETVAPFLASRVLSARSHGTRIRWLTGPKVMARFLLAPFRKRDVLSGAGPAP